MDYADCVVSLARSGIQATQLIIMGSEDSVVDSQSPWWQNATCNPFTPREQPCEIGNYPIYSINVSSAADIIAGVNFAQEKNIRLVIKNTGHE